MKTPAVKLMIESGLIPENILRQLVNWRLLEADSVKSLGNNPVSLESEWETVEEFADNLSDAVAKGMGDIRETEMDLTGYYRTAHLEFAGIGGDRQEEVFVDRLNRVILPARGNYKGLMAITLFDPAYDGPGSWDRQEVVRLERRYRGDDMSTLVVYLESLEDKDAS